MLAVRARDTADVLRAKGTGKPAARADETACVIRAKGIS
jgi:hypothetical protein